MMLHDSVDACHHDSLAVHRQGHTCHQYAICIAYCPQMPMPCQFPQRRHRNTSADYSGGGSTPPEGEPACPRQAYRSNETAHHHCFDGASFHPAQLITVKLALALDLCRGVEMIVNI